MKPKIPGYFVVFCLSMILSSCASTGHDVQKDPVGMAFRRTQSGLFKITQNGKYGFIDKSGTIIINPQFENAGNFSEGLAWVCVGEGCSDSSKGEHKHGYIDRTGKFAVNPQFDYAGPFSDGLAWVLIAEKCGYIDTKGSLVIPPTLSSSCSDFSEGYAKSWPGFIDKTGKQVFQSQIKFESIGNFSEDLATIEVTAGSSRQYGAIDRSGKLVIQPQTSGFGPFSEGLAVINLASQSAGYIDTTGKIVINPQFKHASPFSEGLAAVSKGGDGPAKFGFIDKTGKFVVDPQFAAAGIFTGSVGFWDGLAKVGVEVSGGTKYGYIDRNGKFAINPQFDDADDFFEGLANVGIKRGEGDWVWGWIDTNGKYVWSPTK